MDPQTTPAHEPVVSPTPVAAPVVPAPVVPVTIAAPPPGAAPINAPAKRQGLILGIISLVLFVGGFLFGFASLFGAVAGGIAIRQGKLTGDKRAIITGSIGLALNAIWYLLVITVFKAK